MGARSIMTNHTVVAMREANASREGPEKIAEGMISPKKRTAVTFCNFEHKGKGCMAQCVARAASTWSAVAQWRHDRIKGGPSPK